MLRAHLLLFVCSGLVPPHHTRGGALWPGSVFVQSLCFMCRCADWPPSPATWWWSEGLAWIWWPRWDLVQWVVLSLEPVERNWLHFENITDLLMSSFSVRRRITEGAFFHIGFTFVWLTTLISHTRSMSERGRKQMQEAVWLKTDGCHFHILRACPPFFLLAGDWYRDNENKWIISWLLFCCIISGLKHCRMTGMSLAKHGYFF